MEASQSSLRHLQVKSEIRWGISPPSRLEIRTSQRSKHDFLNRACVRCGRRQRRRGREGGRELEIPETLTIVGQLNRSIIAGNYGLSDWFPPAFIGSRPVFLRCRLIDAAVARVRKEQAYRGLGPLRPSRDETRACNVAIRYDLAGGCRLLRS